MIPRMVIPEEEYSQAYRSYVYELAGRWLDMPVDATDPDLVLARIDEVSQSNHRAVYLRYALPIADEKFASGLWMVHGQAMRRVLLGIRLNSLPYNDFMLNRFCDIVLRHTNHKQLFADPLPEDYKDLQKLVWMFIVSFRKHSNERYNLDSNVI